MVMSPRSSIKMEYGLDDIPVTPPQVKEKITFLARLYLENGDIVEAARTAQVSF